MKAFLPVLLVFAAVSFVPNLEASSLLPACVSGSLLSYQQSAGCVLGKDSGGVLIFSGFTFSVSNPDNADVLNPSQILVTPDPEGLGGGFTLSGFQNAPVLPGQNVTYGIDYFFLIDPGPFVGAADMGVDPPFGDFSITQAICADSFFVPGSDGEACVSNSPSGPIRTSPQTLSVNDSNPPASFTDHLDLNPVVLNFANVENTFTLNGGTTGAGFDAFTTTDTVTDPSAAPEPVSYVLGLVSLLAMGAFRRSLQHSRG
jgi:hypothetical protein